MYDIYTRALAVLEVLEQAERRLHRNKFVRIVQWLKSRNLYEDRSVAYLVDALRPSEALRFRNAMATVEAHFVRLNQEDRDFIRREGPATTGFYMAYLEDHSKVLYLAHHIFIGERSFPGIAPELVEVASSLVASAAWVTKVLIPSVDPRLRGPITSRLQALLYAAEVRLDGTPAPTDYLHQIQRLNRDLQTMRA
ncbi:hypothetical protein Arash_gp129c [Salmonella phage Arash]|nr:hypothetical protein Arash_gp129c [Salmonella phage Arash]